MNRYQIAEKTGAVDSMLSRFVRGSADCPWRMWTSLRPTSAWNCSPRTSRLHASGLASILRHDSRIGRFPPFRPFVASRFHDSAALRPHRPYSITRVQVASGRSAQPYARFAPEAGMG